MTRLDVPAYLLVVGTGLALVGAISIFGPSEVVDRAALTSISGRVDSVARWQRRGNEQLQIDVTTSQRTYHLSQDYDLFRAEPRLASVHVGDDVLALVKPDPFWRNLDWLYEMKRGDQLLVQYETTRAYLLRRETRIRTVLGYGGAVGLVFIVISAVFRIRQGA